MRLRTGFLLLFFCLLPLCAERKVSARQILLITSYDSGTRWTANVEQSFCSYFTAAKTGFAEVDILELGIQRNPSLTCSPENESWLRKKMERKRYDAVVSLGDAATELVLANSKRIPPGARFIFAGCADQPIPGKASTVDMTGLLLPKIFEKNVRIAMRLLPATRKIAVITDGSPQGKQLDRVFRKEAGRITGPDFEFLNGESLGTEEMLIALMQLPPESFVIYSAWRSAKNEGGTPVRQMIRDIFRAAQHPVFTLTDLVPGSGFVGGYLVRGSEFGQEAARLTERALEANKAASIPVQVANAVPVFDWEAMKRWELDLKNLPSGAELPDMPLPLWKRHIPELIILGFFLLVALIALLLAMVLRGRHRKKLNGLFAALPIHVGVVDRKGKILFLQTGSQYAFARPKRLAELPVELLREIEEPIREVFRTEGSYRKEFGSFGRHRQLDFIPLAHEIFGRHCVMWISTDVSELQDAYTAVSQLAERFRLTLESIGDGVIVTDCDEVITMMNPIAVKMIGCDSEQAVGQKLCDVLHILTKEYEFKENETPVTAVLRSGKEMTLPSDTTLISGSGLTFRIAVNAAPIRENDGVISGGVLFFRDMTDEYEKRDILSMQNTILRNAAEVANIVYFRCDLNGVLLPLGGDFSRNWKMADGAPVPPEQWVDPEDLDGYRKQFGKLLSGEADSIHIFYRSCREAGRRVYEMRVSRRNLDESGTEEFYGTIQDITELRENERKFKDNAALLESIMDHLPGHLFVKDIDHGFRYLMCNRNFANLLNLPGSEIIGKRDHQLFPEQESGGRLSDDLALLDSRKQVDTEEFVRDASGNLHVLRTMKTIVPRMDGSRLLLGMSIDITRQSQLEKERMKMIDTLNSYIRCERTVNQCLTRLSMENDFNRAVNEMLKEIGENSGADLCYVFQYTAPDKTRSEKIHEWVRDGIAVPAPGSPKDFNMAIAFHWTEKLLRREDLVIADVSNPPGNLATEAAFLASRDIKSIMVCGIWDDDELWGYIGMAFVRSGREFAETDIHMGHSLEKLFCLARERWRQMNLVEESVSLQTQIVENISIPIAIFDPEFRVLAANTGISDVCGIPVEKLLNRKCCDTICCCTEPPAWCPMCKTLADKLPHTAEHEIHGRRFLLTTQPIFDRSRELSKILMFAIDITELLSQKEQIRKAMEAAQEADRAKSYFIAMMSHELRTPLNAVIGFSELLQMDGISHDELTKNLQAINLAGHTLLNLLNDVFDLSKLENGTLLLTETPTDMKKLFSEMVQMFRHTAELQNFALKLKLPDFLPMLVIDEKRMRQILMNLIANAFKCMKKGKILLSVEFRKSENGENTGSLILKISETGSGVVQESLQMVFEPFHRHASGNDGKPEDNGLELTLSRRLCDLMGGSLAIGGPGCAALFTLHFDDVPFLVSGRSDAEPEALPAPSNEMIVLVDDVPLNLKVMSSMLNRIGVPHICCTSGAEALEVIARRLPAAVFTDLWMPGMNGVELAEKLAADPGTSRIPIFAVTADSRMDDSIMHFFKGVILKPLTLDALKKVLETLPLHGLSATHSGENQ